MPYKDPERKREWEREHRNERNARRRKTVPVSGIDPSPNSMAVSRAGTDANVVFGLVVGLSLLLILLFLMRLSFRDLPETGEAVFPRLES